MHYSVPTNTIRSVLSEHNVTIIDSSDGVVIFKRNCTLMGKANAIEEAFLKKFQEASPLVMIDEKPHISSKASLPSDFQRYQLIGVTIPETTLKKNNGSFVAIFKVGDKERKLYFSYEMNAKVMVFKAKRNLLNGKILSNDDYESVWLSLDDLPARAILHEMSQSIIVKNSVKEGQILTDFHLDVKKMLSKKESIKALFKEQGLVIEVQATLLEDGNVGDVVKIKTEQGKILNAKILSRYEVIILE
jgi:flagella basal body P-ring formation protein FlgA